MLELHQDQLAGDAAGCVGALTTGQGWFSGVANASVEQGTDLITPNCKSRGGLVNVCWQAHLIKDEISLCLFGLLGAKN